MAFDELKLGLSTGQPGADKTHDPCWEGEGGS